MNILYIGSSGDLSLIPFRKLLSSKHSIVAVGVYKPVRFNNSIIALENESLALAANQQELPVIDLSHALSDVIEQCSKYAIDVILMSCYSKRLPDGIINLANRGCYNMHPSLLPRYRGPEPVFWQMKQASDMGVSWHQLVFDFDAGEIVAQQKVVVDEGATYAEINLQLAETGTELMMKLLSDISDGVLIKTVQNPEMASYYPYPQQQDFVIDTGSSAQQAYNFMRATQIFGFPYLCQIKNQCYFLKQALDYDNNSSLEVVEVQGNRLYIPCNMGVLIATYTDKILL